MLFDAVLHTIDFDEAGEINCVRKFSRNNFQFREWERAWFLVVREHWVKKKKKIGAPILITDQLRDDIAERCAGYAFIGWRPMRHKEGKTSHVAWRYSIMWQCQSKTFIVYISLLRCIKLDRAFAIWRVSKKKEVIAW